MDSFAPCLDSFLLVARSVGYAAQLLRPQALAVAQNDIATLVR